ncbi:MAG: BON domain-containing protein [Isosphaeraceae bacterium]
MFAMMKRISTALTVVGAVTAGTTATAQVAATNPNQSTADAVAGALTRSPILFGQRIAVEARQGLVILSGQVSTAEQHQDAIARASKVAGVSAVQDYVRVVPQSDVRPARYQVVNSEPTQVAMGGMHRGGYVSGGQLNGGAGFGSTTGGTVGGGFGDPGAPMPEGAAMAPGIGAQPQPGAPNYAWPSYAPTNNFSAVGYPTAYPWQAWPNIGPFYPYPEVPLDWRAVTLRWDDGIWWLDFKKHYTRPFFTPYPFGLFAY